MSRALLNSVPEEPGSGSPRRLVPLAGSPTREAPRQGGTGTGSLPRITPTASRSTTGTSDDSAAAHSAYNGHGQAQAGGGSQQPTRKSITRLSNNSDDDVLMRPSMASRHNTPQGPESPGLSPKDAAGGGVNAAPHQQSPARFGLGSAQRKRDNSRVGMASAMSVDGGVVESVASADDDARSGKSGSALSNGSTGSASTGTSGMIVNSFGLIDRHVRKVGGVSQLTGLDDLLQDPTAERLSVFRTRFDALFVILDAAVRLTLHPFIVMTPECTVILASPSINALLGFTAEELTGNNINMVMPHSVGHNHDEVVARYVDSIAAGVSERASSVVYNTRPVTARAKDGSPVNVELTVRPILSDDSVADVAAAMGGAAGTSGAPGCPVAGAAGRAGRKREVVLFVAQLRDARAEISLRNIVKESSTLVSLFPFPYIEADEMMTILKFNPAAATAFGISAERAIGKNVMILMPPTIRNVATGHKIRRMDHDKIVRNYVSKIRSVGEANVTSRIVGKKTRHVAQRVNVADSRSISAELFPMELEVRMLLSADGTIKFQAFARDCENYLNAKEAEDAILKQTFPAPVAEAMIAGQDVNGELDLAVIFCDIVKFTALSQLISDAAALKVLDDLFTRFAGIRERLPWMDPIKTNYDEFMAVVGLSTRFPGRNLAEDAVRVALEMQRATRAYNADTGSDIEIRVGIDVGPAQVGLVGASGLKTFDIIGQTTVRASRAENTCDPGRVHITDSTFEMLGALTRDKFEPKKGGVNFKNMGRVATYMSLA